MNPDSTAKIVFRTLLVVALAGLAGGCASYRINTSLEPSKPVPAAQAEAKYIITAVQLVSPTNVPSGNFPAFGTYSTNSDKLRAKLMIAACQARPDMFSQDSAARPVEVTVTRVACDYSLSMGENCLSCLTLTILPIYSGDKAEYTVEVTMPDPTAGPRKSIPVAFSIEQRNWISFWPTGLIPVPGGRGWYTWGPNRAQTKYGNMMLDSCVEAAVAALGHKEPSAWKAP